MEILYDGIGATKERHTEEEFLAIMKKEFTDKDWEQSYREMPRETHFRIHYQLSYKNWNLPQDFVKFTLEDWLGYSGAETTT